jgi:predicted AlkP superfamily phosphohydrolase/phosphomutase
MSTPAYPVLVLGLDGATFDLMLPWIEQGRLPCLGKLLQDGAWSRLRSTIPPITPCAWSSFMTGKNPGKHGLFDFWEPLPGEKQFRFTNASSRHAESLWSYLSRNGRRVGVMNVPMTYPPESVNGYLISGLDTPDDHSRYIYPEEARQELESHGIHYRLDPRYVGNMRTDRQREHQLREHLDIESTRTQALKQLRQKYPSDFTMLVYTATDQIQHHFWQFMDPKHDKYDAKGAEKSQHAIRDVYQHVDGLIASILKEQGDDTVVIIMSDHGFGPCSNVRVRLNQALAHGGLLSFRKEGTYGNSVRSLAGVCDRILRGTLTPGIKRFIARTFPRLRAWFERLDEARIDWAHTKAYTVEISRCAAAIWLNRAGSGREGGVTEDQEEGALQSAEEALKRLTDAKTGRQVISNVYRTRDLYHGPYMNSAPALIPSWWEDGFLLEPSNPNGSAEQIVTRSYEPVRGGVEFAASHRLDGVFIMAGGPARRGHAFTGAQIIDVAPTVLYLMGLPIPGDMDGRPLFDALDPDFVASHPPQYPENGSGPAAPPPNEDASYSDEEAELIAKRLKSLGYIE